MADFSEADFDKAESAGRALLETSPRAIAARYDAERRRVELELANGCSYAFPVAMVQDLLNADEAKLIDLEIDGRGFNLHWPQLDVDLYVPSLVGGIFGTRAWMMKTLARIAGEAKSPAKSAAARANGAKGGRPKKTATTL
jgi:hypothetical protein